LVVHVTKQQYKSIEPRPTVIASTTQHTQLLVLPSGTPSNMNKPAAADKEQHHDAVVTPELLVDALSGHEDGLLAIAEKLMESYDAGYDVMGECIIDAFADVQKLFQHVVEAAHMEGAAFEASRREAEMANAQRSGDNTHNNAAIMTSGSAADLQQQQSAGPSRHDEFIDQDVKDVLTEAIRTGTSLRELHKHLECYHLYEHACQNASSLLPVDSDHRGRLQLSIARAESMSPDRACAILRYAMDDVLRSGLRSGKGAALPDTSKRGDCVLSKPKDYPSLNGSARVGVVQSSEEALASLVEEMKEVLAAPIYDNTPLQSVAERFWLALGEAQRHQLKNEERLEQSLGKLKGDFLLARAEWEEKLTSSQEQADFWKKKYNTIKDANKGESYMEQARLNASKLHETRDASDGVDLMFDSMPAKKNSSGSVASLSTGLAQHARSIVGSFNCAGTSDPEQIESLNRRAPVSFSKSFSSQASSRRGRSRTQRNSLEDD